MENNRPANYGKVL